MNISSENTTYDVNSSDDFFRNDTEVETNYICTYIMHILLSFPLNSYVIWLIVTGTGNGLASEFFILNLAVCEMIICVESFLNFLWFELLWMVVVFFDGFAITGRPLFQCLICVERYLAVVHPVTFLKYKPLRYRLVCAAGAWLAAFAYGGVNLMLSFLDHGVLLIVPFTLFFSVQLFFCLAVLRALKRSGPGERGREREEENHMKKRAFHLILITTVATALIYGPYFALICISPQMSAEHISITAILIGDFFYDLTGLVQPVFFLYRVGKLNVIKCQ